MAGLEIVALGGSVKDNSETRVETKTVIKSLNLKGCLLLKCKFLN